MGLKIIKSVSAMQNKIVVAPEVSRFFYELKKNVGESSMLRINAEDFLDDSGNRIDSLPALNMMNSYFNVYINGILQMDDIFSYTSGGKGIGNLLVSLPEETEIELGTPIILEVINFEPTVKSGT
ncbi:DUF4183 domain-containing protein [Lysinibacillus sp. SGAir0095]|uniref:DUF4183 domain-containing protein n=1 Tax=Lysinibacillus sp. SGAir0095 TaxID=2070463 RepID=UPI0010CCFEA8|nr:DUF4183 domain-containing protein [Lysinibacillus sp. SGAir0095]QCR34291.1 hypothetical protein C1N55_20170 [Lysinibacillus sp. SGAir0095]